MPLNFWRKIIYPKSWNIGNKIYQRRESRGISRMNQGVSPRGIYALLKEHRWPLWPSQRVSNLNDGSSVTQKAGILKALITTPVATGHFAVWCNFWSMCSTKAREWNKKWKVGNQRNREYNSGERQRILWIAAQKSPRITGAYKAEIATRGE